MANENISFGLFDKQSLAPAIRHTRRKYNIGRPTTRAGRAAKGRRAKYTDEQLRAAVVAARSLAHVMRLLGMADSGSGNYKSIHESINRLSLDTSHFLGMGWNKGNRPSGRKVMLCDVLDGSTPYRQTSSLRRRLIKEGVFENKCSECGITDWHGKPLSLHLDHKNGVNSDHKLENLRLLCPNCHSQTDNFGSKNRGTYARIAQSVEARP